MRGLAALGVVFFHSMTALWIGMNYRGPIAISGIDKAVAYASIPLHYGYAGVMLFFLLSGFVIHLPYAHEKSPFLYWPYIARRFTRIYPPYVAALLMTILVWVAFPHVIILGRTHETIVKAFLMVQNYPHYGGPAMELAWRQPLNNTALWSLPVELELYLVYPAALLARRAFGLTPTSIGIALISVAATSIDVFVNPRAATAHGVPQTLASYLPTFLHYWAIWWAGAWLSDRMVARRLPRWTIGWSLVSLVLLPLALAYRLKLHGSRDVEDIVWAALFFCCIVWLVSATERVAAFDRAGVRPLRYLGKISYSLYLIHLPVFYVIAATAFSKTGYRVTDFLGCFAAVAVAVIVAAGFYELVERPSSALSRRIGRKPSPRMRTV